MIYQQILKHVSFTWKQLLKTIDLFSLWHYLAPQNFQQKKHTFLLSAANTTSLLKKTPTCGPLEIFVESGDIMTASLSTLLKAHVSPTERTHHFKCGTCKPFLRLCTLAISDFILHLRALFHPNAVLFGYEMNLLKKRENACVIQWRREGRSYCWIEKKYCATQMDSPLSHPISSLKSIFCWIGVVKLKAVSGLCVGVD